MPKIIDKLGQLEDIEEELGIDLITLFKALKNGFYAKVFCGCLENYREYKKADFKERVLHVKVISFHNFYKYFTCEVEDNLNKGLWNGCKNSMYLKNYGKTWALTKEELL